jgi:Flp pilus assembly protein TadG
MKSFFQIGLSNIHTLFSALQKRCGSLSDESGNAIVELALVVPLVFVPLLLGSMELAQVVFDSIEVSNAAHAGANWGMMNSTSTGLDTGITTAAQGEAMDFGTSLTVTPTVYWACSAALSGTQYTSLSAAMSGCTGTSNHPLEMIKVVTSAPVTIPIKCPGLPSTFTLTGLSVTETE